MSAPFAFGPAILFCPADRPERYAKARERADAVIIDLEDAVAPAAKPAARGALIDAEFDPDGVIVRVNPVGTRDFADDMATLSQTDHRVIMLPKAESPKKIGAIDSRFTVIALCETARGVENADRIAALGNVVALTWGAEDLVASLGGTASRNARGRYRDLARYARSRVLIAAGAHGKSALDTVHLDIADVKGLKREAKDAAASGFAASMCIHPSQVDVIRDAYRPPQAETDWARRVLDAATRERGVFAFEGRMVDEPVLRHARRLLDRS